DDTFNGSDNGKITDTPMKYGRKILSQLSQFCNITNMQTTYGAWMSDAARFNEDRYWLAEHFSGRMLLEYQNAPLFLNTSKKITDIKMFYQGCGHIISNGSFYFHKAGSNQLIKFDLETGRTKAVKIENSRYNKLSYLFNNSKTYFKFAVDENGLWVIFASSSHDTVMVAKLKQDPFSVQTVIDTAYPKMKTGNGFIAHGILYITDVRDRRVTYTFDLKKESSFGASFDLRLHDGILTMLSYYPKKQLLYLWDNGSVKNSKTLDQDLDNV
uniref:Olfactomedin-like domain-containing protein n=1 Tax=Myripristis murdjan TaxID=586833 RepID=A0A667ZJI7_9TELE